MILDVSIVACTREPGVGGGSPTALVREQPLSGAQRCSVPALAGTSHAVFADEKDGVVSLRFFTSEGELPACGHGTIAGVRASGALDKSR
jgi:trans-2,3-dihydro-3-hydroxyanthranilate isomerase